MISMKTLKAEFSLAKVVPNSQDNNSKKINMISWGDCMCWDLDSVRDGIIDLYGEKSVTNIKKGSDGVYYFKYDDKVDFSKVGKHIGVSHSGPSQSIGVSHSGPSQSSSSTATKSNFNYEK